MSRAAGLLTGGVLAGLAGLHVAWGAGAAFPARNRTDLADLVAGADEVPGPSECFAVAGLLAVAATIVAGVGPVAPPLRRIGAVGVAAVLGARGVAGLTGTSSVLVAWQPSPRFVALDRRVYGPLCLALALGTLLSLRPRPTLVPQR